MRNEQEEIKKAWLKTFDVLLFCIKTMVFFIAGFLLYIPFEKDFKEIFTPKPITTADTYFSPSATEELDRIENGIHVQTGLVYAPGFELVKANCTVCHSSKLITQNRATKEGWEQMIDWMQETQGLWDLGNKKEKIVTYLAKNYAPESKGRRENINLSEVEWYILELNDTLVE